MIVIVDADYLVYRAANASYIRYESEDEACRRAKQLLDDVLQSCSCTQYVAYLTGSKKGFRSSVDPMYKAGRDHSSTRRGHFDAIYRYLLTQPGVYKVDEIEADDACVIMHRRYPGSILASTDKDMLQSCGKHYNITRRSHFTVLPGVNNLIKTTTPNNKTKIYATGPYARYFQMLTGDTADNIKGVPGVGPIKAFKMLKGLTLDGVRRRVYTEYEAAFGDSAQSEFYKNIRLLTLLTHSQRLRTPLVNYTSVTHEREDQWNDEDPSVFISAIQGDVPGIDCLQGIEWDGNTGFIPE